jgi:hypothetical protein
MFVGGIMVIKAKKSILDENGNPDIEKIRPIVYGTCISRYYGIGRNLGKAFSIMKEC